ncbi:MAG: hypothetical protein ACP5GD_02670 [Candidatus Micrarchaeia archaeon]
MNLLAWDFRKAIYILAAITLATGVVTAAQSSSLQASVLSLLCGIVGFVRAIVGVLAVVLFILGGVLYAVGHFLPSTGNLRSSIQGWAMGMLFAGVVAVIIFIIAQPLVSMITGLGVAAGSAGVKVSCP